jgi:hypothetical protein
VAVDDPRLDSQTRQADREQGVSMRTAILASVGTLMLMGRAVGTAAAQGVAAPLPTWLWGEWSRDWIQKGKIKTNTLDVHYLQTPTYFADVRIPKDRFRGVSAVSFAELTDQQLKMLAGQSGFTGLTAVAGSVATWQHEIDFQPSDGTADEGRLERIPPNRMQEHGLDGSYVESWKSRSDGKERFLVLRVEHSGRLLRTLVVVGNRFVYIRNRARDLPMATSLDALIKSTNATRQQMVEFLDCEFSVGRVRGRSVPWEIEQSTLPWSEGRHLKFVEEISVHGGESILAPREVGEDKWVVPVNTFSPRQLQALFREKKHR